MVAFWHWDAIKDFCDCAPENVCVCVCVLQAPCQMCIVYTYMLVIGWLVSVACVRCMCAYVCVYTSPHYYITNYLIIIIIIIIIIIFIIKPLLEQCLSSWYQFRFIWTHIEITYWMNKINVFTIIIIIDYRPSSLSLLWPNQIVSNHTIIVIIITNSKLKMKQCAHHNMVMIITTTSH